MSLDLSMRSKVRYKCYDIMVTLRVAEGSFNDIKDVMQYIEYRLNLRGRNSDSVRMENICLLGEKFIQLDVNDQLG